MCCVTILTDFSGEYKTILQLVGVLSHGKTAKQMADGAIDLMQDVQNLRKAVYECAHPILFPGKVLTLPGRSNKLKLGACEKGSTKYNKLFNLAANYLFVSIRLLVILGRTLTFEWDECRYRYGVLIVFANYLIERRFGEAKQDTFPDWLSEHREITKLLGRRSLD